MLSLDTTIKPKNQRNREECIFTSPVPLLNAEDMIRNRTLAVSLTGDEAAIVAQISNLEKFSLGHTDPDIRFQSSALPRIIEVGKSHMLVWAHPPGHPAGIFRITANSQEFLGRLDQLFGVRPTSECVVPYGCNQDDPAGTQRYFFGDSSFLVPNNSGRFLIGNKLLVVERMGNYWLESAVSRKGVTHKVLFDLPRDALFVLPLRWEKLSAYIVRRPAEWSLWHLGREFIIAPMREGKSRSRIVRVWGSPTERAIAFLLEFEKSTADPPWIPPWKKLLLISDVNRPEEVNVLEAGRFRLDASRIRWSENGVHLAASLDWIKTGYDDDLNEKAVSYPVLVSSGSGCEPIIGEIGESFHDPVIDAHGRIIAYIRESGGRRNMVCMNGEDEERHHAWQPWLDYSERCMYYSFTHGREIYCAYRDVTQSQECV